MTPLTTIQRPAPHDLPAADATRDAAERPKVSVEMITFDQERYVAQALESALAQETPFPFEIVVADDASRDGTPRILRDYARRHPQRIRLLERPQNLGIVPNFLQTFRACDGEYVAFLEGDDYWTSPHKLSRQAELMDRRPELSLSYHAATMRQEVGGACVASHRNPPAGATPISSLEELLRGDCMLLCTTMVRNHLIGDPPAWCDEMPVGDLPLIALHALHGPIGYLDEDMAVYRQHEASAWSSLSRAEKLPRKIAGRQLLAAGLGAPYDAILAPVIAALQEELAALSLFGEVSTKWQ